MNPHGLAACGFSYRLRLSPPRRSAIGAEAGLRSGLSLHLFPVLWGLGAARLVSTPSRRSFPPGLARDCHYRVPRIWAVLLRRFPGEHSSCLKSAAYAIPPRPRGRSISYDKSGCGNLRLRVVVQLPDCPQTTRNLRNSSPMGLDEHIGLLTLNRGSYGGRSLGIQFS